MENFYSHARVGKVTAADLRAALEQVAGHRGAGQPVPVVARPAVVRDRRAQRQRGVGDAAGDDDLRAGLEDLRSLLNREAANDDFMVLSATLASPVTADRVAALEGPSAVLQPGEVAALQAGLGAAWDQTVVLVATEFGRTAAANGTGGTAALAFSNISESSGDAGFKRLPAKSSFSERRS